VVHEPVIEAGSRTVKIQPLCVLWLINSFCFLFSFFFILIGISSFLEIDFSVQSSIQMKQKEETEDILNLFTYL